MGVLVEAIESGPPGPTPILTVFACPKPFVDTHISRIQRNAIRSWAQLGTGVEVLVLGEEDGTSETARALGVRHLGPVERNPDGTPLLSSIFSLAREASVSPLLCYVNADILLLGDLLPAVRKVSSEVSEFLVVGQRSDLEVTEELSFGPGWENALRDRVRAQGRPHPPAGSDFFVFPETCFEAIPPFALGRASWDNWMIYFARRKGWTVVDVTPSVTIIHQNHTYNHLPGGRPHYRLPESQTNLRLAGGRRRVFTLRDANRILVDGRLKKLRMTRHRFLRELEILPLIVLGSSMLAEMAFLLAHPKRGWIEWRSRLHLHLRQMFNAPATSKGDPRSGQG